MHTHSEDNRNLHISVRVHAGRFDESVPMRIFSRPLAVHLYECADKGIPVADQHASA